MAPERRRELEGLVGRTLGGKYRLERLLGAGGMGGVYEARGPGGERVAVKVLSVLDPASRERVMGRFTREARAASAVASDHIVGVIDAGTDAGRPFIVMELLEGEDLGHRLRSAGRLPEAEALHVAAQILAALAVTHDAGVVHRDLKPDNVFLCRRPDDPCFVKVVDFGMSKLAPKAGATLPLALTGKGLAVGTPSYMSPEQARALADVDGRADLWAVGAILFECLTGSPPFVASAQEQVLIAICTVDAPEVRSIVPAVSEPVARLVKEALSRDRANRFPTAWHMLRAITDLAPAEMRLLPHQAVTRMDTVVTGPPAEVAALLARAVPPEASGPYPAPEGSGAILLPADASGSNAALRASAPRISVPRVSAPAVVASRPLTRLGRPSRAPVVAIAIAAALLGGGVTTYLVASARAKHRREVSSEAAWSETTPSAAGSVSAPRDNTLEPLASSAPSAGGSAVEPLSTLAPLHAPHAHATGRPPAHHHAPAAHSARPGGLNLARDLP